MTDDVRHVTATLRQCLRIVAATVADDPPPWNPSTAPAVRSQPWRRTRRRSWATGLSFASVAAIAATVLWATSSTTPSAPMALIAATEQTLAAHTARLTLTATPTQGPSAAVATGVVDFDRSAAQASYPSGFTMIYIDDEGWTTTQPTADPKTWQRIPAPQPGTASGLLRALRPNSAPTALLATLRAETETFHEVTTDRDGARRTHYRATIDRSWQADVWVDSGRLHTITVRSPAGTSTVRYYDYGIPVHVASPTAAVTTES